MFGLRFGLAEWRAPRRRTSPNAGPAEIRIIRLSPAARPGAFTLFHWVRVFASGLSEALFYRPLPHSLVTSASIGLLAVALGAGLAWLTTRTDLPGRKLVAALATVPYILPSYTYALAWLTLFRTASQALSRRILVVRTRALASPVLGSFQVRRCHGISLIATGTVLPGSTGRNELSSYHGAVVLFHVSRIGTETK